MKNEKNAIELPEIYEPDAELLAFAKDFSQNYKILSVGDYTSDHNKYHIRYMLEFLSCDRETPGVIRIGYEKDVIEISHTELQKDFYNSDFVLFLILWISIQKQCQNRIETDSLTLAYCFNSNLFEGRKNEAIKNILKGWGKTLRKSFSEETIKRYEALRDYIDEFKKGEEDGKTKTK